MQVTKAQPTLRKRKAHTDVNTRRGDLWGPSQRMPATMGTYEKLIANRITMMFKGAILKSFIPETE